jgi:hypothetical protein
MNNAKGLIVYNELEAELQQAFNASPYLLNKLLPKLKSTVFMPRLNNANIPILCALCTKCALPVEKKH